MDEHKKTVKNSFIHKCSYSIDYLPISSNFSLSDCEKSENYDLINKICLFIAKKNCSVECCRSEEFIDILHSAFFMGLSRGKRLQNLS